MDFSIHELSQKLAERAEDLCRALLPSGKRVGRQWKVGSAYDEPGDSMDVELEGPKAGLWNDMASNEGGDLIELIKLNKMCRNAGDAAKWARQFLGLPAYNSSDKPKDFIDPLKIGFKRGEETAWRYGSKAWAYHDEDGKIIGWVVRFELPGGKKDVLPLRIIDGKPKWKGWKSPETRPIYNLHLLKKRPEAPILIVEGEKTADAAAKLFSSHVVLTWLGGTKSVTDVEWKPVIEAIAAGREVILWPDADRPGRDAMTYLKARFIHAKLVRTSDLPEKWDLADPVPEGISIQGLLDSAGDISVKITEPKQETFRCLGHDSDGFYYMSYAYGHVYHWSPSEHTESNLLLLASEDYWRSKECVKWKENTIDWKMVYRVLIAEQQNVGFFDPNRVRGLGCWLEGETVILHAGDCLYINGVKTPIGDHKSKYIYPRRRTLEVNLNKVATVEDTAKLYELTQLLPWSDSTKRLNMSWILPAMCFLAPICGALSWRPSIWLTGGPASGKSWIFTNYWSKLIGPFGIQAVSATTAAGLRQFLVCDALAVLFDEIEGNTERARARITAIMELLRQSSSESGGVIYHGSSDGAAKSYRIRSSFLFSSIVSSAIEPADQSRIAILELVQNKSELSRANFEKILAIWEKTLSLDSYCSAFQARAIMLASRVRQAVAIMERAIALVCGDGRKGQQFGALAAGFWVMSRDDMPTLEDAMTWAKSVSWKDLGAGDDQNSDSSRAVDHILQAKCQYQDNDGHRFDATVGELIEIYLKRDIKSDAAYDALMRIGIHCVHNAVDFATNHSGVNAIFKGTHLETNYKDHLLRVPGATQSYFLMLGGKNTRAVRIPLSEITNQQQLPL